jgi:aminocarboxymuconate-semialdehyde decarboxylase
MANSRAIDIHAHYFPQAYLDILAEAEARRAGADYITGPQGFTAVGGGTRNGPLPRKFIDLEARLADMDRTGVALEALSLTTPMLYWADGPLSLRLARAFNDAASDAHRAYPDRFVGLMALPMLYPDHAIAELDRAHRLQGMRGVYLGTNIEGRDLDDPLFAPVFARIEALGLPVFLHPVKPLPSERLKPFYLGNLLGNPFDTAIAASHLIFGGVLDRHPALEVNLPHAGGALPILIGRLDHGRVVRQEARHLHQPPSAYLRRFTYDTISHSKPIMQFVIAQVGADRVMLGSDYCFDMGNDNPVANLAALDLPAREQDMILGGNAARLLKL